MWVLVLGFLLHQESPENFMRGETRLDAPWKPRVELPPEVLWQGGDSRRRSHGHVFPMAVQAFRRTRSRCATCPRVVSEPTVPTE